MTVGTHSTVLPRRRAGGRTAPADAVVYSLATSDGDEACPRPGEAMPVNVTEGLAILRERLLDNDADAKTIALLDGIARRAALPNAQGASASLLQLTRMLARSPAATNDIAVYNDLLKLEEQLEAGAAAYRARQDSDERQAEAHAQQRTKKYYRELKEREKERGG